MKTRRRTQQSRGELQQDSGRRTSGRDLFQIEVEKEVLHAFRALFNNSGIIPCNKRAWIARVKPKNLNVTLLFEQWKYSHH